MYGLIIQILLLQHVCSLFVEKCTIKHKQICRQLAGRPGLTGPRALPRVARAFNIVHDPVNIHKPLS